MKTRNTNVHIFLGQSTLRYILMYGENAILNHMKRIFGGGGLRPSNTEKVDSFLISLLKSIKNLM